MKRRYKLLIIIGVGVAITLFISNLQGPSKTTLTAIGDSFSLGMTSYKIPGASFNDYLKEYILKRNDLENYDDEFSVLHLRIKDLNDYLEKNVIGKKTHQPLKQIIDKSDIVTIAIGMDEFVEKSLIDKISEDDKKKAEEKLEVVKKALEGTDVDEIKNATEELNKVAMDLAQKVYEQAAKENNNATNGNDSDHEKVEDATYEEK